jgi:broad specificity phosphatase PhoE
MRIVLARHGRPDATADDRRPIRGTDIGLWCRRYDALGIASTPAPPPALRALAISTACIIASDARRAIDSARLLAGSRPIQVDARLREAGLPETLRLRTRLPPQAWVVAARIAWLLDQCASEETLTIAQQRAAGVAAELTAVARAHQDVLVVGHGWLNRLVAGELLRQGWRGPRPHLIRNGYWASRAYFQ